jgi:DNA gyrase subunit B
MTDADIDGAHIRTLLLTFFFRQMPGLFLSDRIYIAQSPLYEVRVKGQKKSEYVLNESQMRKRMISRGLENTVMVIKDDRTPKKAVKARRLSDKEFSALVKILDEAERVIAVLGRRGINFYKFVEAYYDPHKGGLPCFRISVEGKDEIYYESEDYEKRLDELKERMKSLAEKDEEELIVAEELHEVGRINQINEELKKNWHLDLKEYLLKSEKSVSGETLPTKFQLINGQELYDIASLGDVCAAIRQIGGKGIEIKRFKGLGEMNAEQLWETTMNPHTRHGLRIADTFIIAA